MATKKQDLFKFIKLNDQGLIPAIAQDYKNHQILMMGWMNEESLKMTMKKKSAHYFSRSRGRLWQKGETSGSYQEVKEILIDCDYDCLILKVKQKGVACHTGRKSCFFNNIDEKGKITINQEVLISPNELYNKNEK